MKRVHLVSGVTSGIGKAFCDLLQKKGEEVIPIVRSKEKIKNRKFKKIIELDFSDPSSVETALKSFDNKINSFVNCAAILPGRSFLEQGNEDLQRIFNINIITPLLIVKKIVRQIKKDGAIVLFGSISSEKGSYDDPYAATKGAIHSLTKSLSLKLAPDIRINCIAPGITDLTRMTDELVPGIYEKNIVKVPLKRAVQPVEMAEIIYFLLSEHSKSITGAMLDVNGGQYLR